MNNPNYYAHDDQLKPKNYILLLIKKCYFSRIIEYLLIFLHNTAE